MSIRWKFVLVCLIIVFIPIFFLNKYSIEFFDRFTRTALEKHMIDHAYVVGREYVAAANGGDEALAAFQSRLEEYGPELQTRIRIVASNGLVAADSAGPANRDDVSDRREIRLAMDGRYGARNQLTPDNQYMYYYVALPIRSDGRTLAIAYLSRHTGHIIGAINSMIRSHRVAYGISLAVAAAVAVFLSLTLIHPLRRLTKAARRFARGDQSFECRVRGHDEIAQLQRAIESMATEIERKNSYNRDFLAAAAHELKTPLAAIQATAEVLEDAACVNAETRSKFVGNIQFEVQRLGRLVGELRELTRIDSQSIRDHSAKVNYDECIEEILERILPTLPDEKPKIELALRADSVRVRMVAEQIEQVLANLIENAIRHTPADGRIEIATEPNPPGFITTRVSDTGRGIDPGNVGRVFDRFFTTESAAGSQSFGAGLGLAIARSIIRNHGGEIRVESTPDQGTIFAFTLPVV